jgi:hypothetical protein
MALAISMCVLGSATAASGQTHEALDPAAVAILRRMTDHLRNMPSFRVHAEFEYDAVQADGQTIEFGSIREVSVRRPDRLRAEATDRSGARRSIFYDGRQLTLLDWEEAVYASAEKTGDLDAILGYAAEHLGIPIPFGELISNQFGEQMKESLVFAAVVGVETLEGVRCDHLALRNPDRGIQLWVQQGEEPLLRRISITYEQAPGRPQFRAQITKWQISPRLPDSHFAFELPKGMERIRFYEPLAAATPTGGK